MPRIRQEFARPSLKSAAPIAQPVLPRDGEDSRLRQRLMFAIGPTLLIAMGVTVVASAQSNSPFATERKTQAWETPAAAQPIPSVEPRSPATQPVPASVNRGLAGPAPSLRLRSAPQTQSDAMTGRVAPKPAAQPTPARRSAPAPVSAAPDRPAPVETRVIADVPETAPSVASPLSTGTVLTPEQVRQRMAPSGRSASLGATSTGAPYGTRAIPDRWALGSNHSAGIQSGSSFNASSQSWSAQSRTVTDTQESVPTRQAGAYQPRQNERGATDWSEFEPEAPLPYAYYPPGTQPSAQRMAQQGQNQSRMGQDPQASPYARSQNRPQAWEQGAQPSQTSPYQAQPQNPSTATQGPFSPGPNARVPQGQQPVPQQTPQQPGPYDHYYQDGYTPGPFDTPQQSGSYTGPQSGPYSGPQSGPMDQGQQAPRSWFDRIGLGALSTFIRGGLRLGAGAQENDSWGEVFIGDADIEAEVSAVTQGGLEWGIHGQVRGQYDEGRKGFTRRLPDCPPTLMGCPSVLVAGTPTAVRGHTSQFYTFGPDVGEDTRIALESAHLFLRSAYGDVTVGRDDGAAYLFSLGAPTLLNVGASNSGVDYTGLDAVRTRNEASGFAEKITYTSPRLLGDQVGIGIQIGASYAPDAEACGVDYCVEPNSIAGVVAPEIEDVLEAGIALDRTFASGMSVEGTLTYARGSEQSGLAELDDLQTFGAGVEVKLSDWALGGSFLQSNQGLMAGDYTAYDVGLTWQPSQLGFTLGYGHAEDDLVGLTSDQFVGGVTFDLNERIRLGAGVQYTDRETRRDVAGTAQFGSEKATALFIEGGLKF